MKPYIELHMKQIVLKFESYLSKGEYLLIVGCTYEDRGVVLLSNQALQSRKNVQYRRKGGGKQYLKQNIVR